MYSGGLPTDKGTLLQLKLLVDRSSYGKVPKNNMKNTEDFLETVLNAHILAAAKQLMSANNLPIDCNVVAKALVEKFVKISLSSDEPNSSAPCYDFVQAYATDFLTIGLLWHGFHDAIREGDGNRLLTYWKFLTFVFKQEGHRNYAKEGFNLTAQSLLLSPRKVAELKWSRTINTHGHAGKNIPVDLHMEHLNRNLKRMLHQLGSNITPETVQRASKALGAVDAVCCNFEEVTEIPVGSSHHSKPPQDRDVTKMVEQLETEQVFANKGNRQHRGFKKHEPLMSSIDWEKMKDWIKEQVNNYDVYNNHQ